MTQTAQINKGRQATGPAADKEPVADYTSEGRARFPGWAPKPRSSDPWEMRSINVKVPGVVRQVLKLHAARAEVDIQDVALDALVEHLERQGWSIPRNDVEYQDAKKAGVL